MTLSKKAIMGKAHSLGIPMKVIKSSDWDKAPWLIRLQQPGLMVGLTLVREPKLAYMLVFADSEDCARAVGEYHYSFSKPEVVPLHHLFDIESERKAENS